MNEEESDNDDMLLSNNIILELKLQPLLNFSKRCESELLEVKNSE